MKTRVNPVVKTRIAGAMASTVITMMMSTADDGLFRPLTFTLTFEEAASNETRHGTSEAQGGVPAKEAQVVRLSDELSSPVGVRERRPCLGGVHPVIAASPGGNISSRCSRGRRSP